MLFDERQFHLHAMTDAAPITWNADARSRAQTRGLLNALARDRGALKRPLSDRWPIALATFGLIPLLRPARLFLSQERYEWSLLQSVASWMFSYTPSRDEASDLSRWAAYWLRSAGGRWRNTGVLSVLIVAESLLGLLLITVPRGQHSPGRAFRTLSDTWRLSLVIIAITWLVHLALVVMHRWRVRGWMNMLNHLLDQKEKRAIKMSACWGFSVVVTGVALLITQIMVFWPIALAIILLTRFVIASHLREVRRINLQLIERLLEWMDDSGLSVEYDVVALNPDEIAAMIG